MLAYKTCQQIPVPKSCPATKTQIRPDRRTDRHWDSSISSSCFIAVNFRNIFAFNKGRELLLYRTNFLLIVFVGWMFWLVFVDAALPVCRGMRCYFWSTLAVYYNFRSNMNSHIFRNSHRLENFESMNTHLAKNSRLDCEHSHYLWHTIYYTKFIESHLT